MSTHSWNGTEVTAGEVIGGKYRVERLVGAGGMGYVVAATHLELDEPVAIKLLFPHSASNGEAVARFLREARTAVKIKSRHVVRTQDVGRLPSGTPFIVMELLEGVDLGGALAERGPLPWATAVVHTLEACEALAEAHALGIVHRDVKPSNLFLARHRDGSEFVKVLDFGISKLTQGDGSFAATHTTAVMGSPLYMPPEQLASARNASAVSDIWSLGATLYELVAGRPPFQGDSLPALCTAIVTTEPPPLRSLCPEVPDGVAAVIHRCLSKPPTTRPSSMLDLASQLAPFAPRGEFLLTGVEQAAGRAPAERSTDRTDPAARAVEPDPSDRGATSGTFEPSLRDTSRARRNGAQLVLAAGLLITAIVVGVVVLRAPRGAQPGASREPTAASVEVKAPTEATRPAASTPAVAVEVDPGIPAPPSASAAPSLRPVATPIQRRPTPASTAAPPPATGKPKDLFGDRF